MATPVVLLLSCGITALLSHTANAYQTIYNPFTGRLDYVGVSSSALPGGSTQYIQNNTSSLVQNATFYVSSGTANTFYAPFLQGTTYYFQTPGGNLNLALFRPGVLNDFGGEAGTLSLTGTDNSGFGNSACGVLTNGSSNSCFGILSLNNAGSASGNSCSGFNSCSLLVDGSSNTASGANALAGGSHSQFDTAGGFNSLANANENSGSGDNTGFGKNSCMTITTGTRDLCLGSNADVGVSYISSATVIGFGSKANDNQSIVIGPNSVSSGTLTAVIGSSSGVTNEFRLVVSSITTKQAIITGVKNSVLATDNAGTIISTTGIHLTQSIAISSWTGNFQTTSTSFVAISSSAVTITPTSVNSCVAFFASGVVQNQTAGKNCYLTMFQGGVNLAVSSIGNGDFAEVFVNTGGTVPIYNNYSFSSSTCPATTSALTYQINFRTDSGGNCIVGEGAPQNQAVMLWNYQ